MHQKKEEEVEEKGDVISFQKLTTKINTTLLTAK